MQKRNTNLKTYLRNEYSINKRTFKTKLKSIYNKTNLSKMMI